MRFIANRLYFFFSNSVSSYLCIIDPTQNTYTSYKFSSGITGNDIVNDAFNNRLIIVGSSGNRAKNYMIQSLEENLKFSADLTYQNSSQSVIQPMPDSEFPITSGGEVSISFNYSPVLASYSLPQATSGVTPVNIESNQSDIFYVVDDINLYGLPISTFLEITVNLTCSVSGSTSISYWLYSLNLSDIPSWCKLDANNSKLLLSIPYLSSPTNYTFQIAEMSTESTTINYRNVKLQVNCMVANCQSCEAGSIYRCSKCLDGYSIYTNLKLCETSQVSATIKSIGITIKSVLCATVAAIGISSAFSTSSTQGIWTIVNQFQIILVLLLTGVYFPKDIIDMMKGNNIFMFSFNFISITDYNILSSFKQTFDFNVDDEDLKYIGLSSGSTLINNFSLFLAVIALISLHLITEFLLCVFMICIHKWVCCKKLSICLRKLFRFSIYLRLAVQSSMFLLICSLYEIKQFRIHSWSQILSLAIACWVFAFCTKFSFALLRITVWYEKGNDCKAQMAEELFKDLKDHQKSKLAKWYSLSICLRNYLLVSFLMFGANLSPTIKIVVLIVIEFIYFVYFVIARAHNKRKENIIEILNVILILILSIFLLFFHSIEDWNKANTNIFISIITANSILICLINLINSVILLTQKFCRYLKISKVQPKPSNNDGNNINSIMQRPVSNVSFNNFLPIEEAKFEQPKADSFSTPHNFKTDRSSNKIDGIQPQFVNLNYERRQNNLHYTPRNPRPKEKDNVSIDFLAKDNRRSEFRKHL